MMGEQFDPAATAESSAQGGRWLRLRRWLGRVWPFPVMLVLALFGVWLYGVLFPPPPPLTSGDVDAAVVEAMSSATPPPAYSAQVYQLILPSLVVIQVQGEDPEDESEMGIGSGVVVNEMAHVLTAFHVVADAANIDITFADGTRASAQIIGVEPENDIAVLQASTLPELIVPATLGNPNGMRIGDETFAVGNPLGLAGSLSAGVISGFDRSLPVNEEGQRLEGLIQFDAAVNPGNSGGPLLNRRGEVIGIVTALANPIQQNSFSGIGFAVPIDTASGAAGAPPY